MLSSEGPYAPGKFDKIFLNTYIYIYIGNTDILVVAPCIQSGFWSKAEVHSDLQILGPPNDRTYVSGFLLCKQSQFLFCYILC